MSSFLNPTLVNSPFSDPVLFLEMAGRSDAFLFDIGDVSRLAGRKLMKVSRVFVSHTHIDHFFGFDQLLRVSLGKPTPIFVYGPRGIIRNVKGKLAAYTWNLIKSYSIEIIVNEITSTGVKSSRFRAKNAMKEEKMPPVSIVGDEIFSDEQLAVRAVILDHKIPVLAFLLSEVSHIKVNKEALEQKGLKAGKWLSELKAMASAGELSGMVTPEDIPTPAKALAEELLFVREGAKLAYITDIAYSKSNIKKLKAFAVSPDILFCEAFFSGDDSERAKDRYHLTATQTTEIARMLGAKKTRVFHFSPRYKGRAKAILSSLQTD